MSRVGFLLQGALDALVVMAIILFVPGFPPYVDFVTFTLEPALPLEGKLAPNTKLDAAVPILEDANILGPESIAVRKDEVYTGVIGGEVIRYKNGKMDIVAKFGSKCEGQWEEAKCGRPLGMRFGPDGKLVVADAYYGLFRVDVDSGAVETLVSSNNTINGKKPMNPNDLDIAKDGTIYWSDSSTNVWLQDALIELMSEPSGRLIKYDPKTKECTVLADGIHFANGIQLSRNEDFLLMSETVRSRVMKYHLKGPKSGQLETFIDGLPGSPDNIRSNGRSGFFVSLIVPRYHDRFSIVEVLGPHPWARKFLMRLMCMVKALLSGIQAIGSIEFVDKAQYWIGHFEPAASVIPKHAIILELDEAGNIISSPQGIEKVSHISEITLDNEQRFAYLGSPYNTQIWKIPVDKIRPANKIPEMTFS